MGWFSDVWDWFTGHDSEAEEGVVANFDKVDDVVTNLNNIKTNQVQEAQDAVRDALNALNNVNGMQYVGSIDTGAFNGVFESISSSIGTIASTLQQNANDIKEYDEASWLEKAGSTILMGVSKIGEGLLSVAEDLGDGICSIVGWTAGLLGADGVEKNISEFVKKDWSHDLMDSLYYSTDFAKKSAITEDSGAASLCKLGGEVGGYILAGSALSAVAPGLTAVKGGVEGAKTMAKVNGIVAATAGLGSGTEAGLQAGKSLGDAMFSSGLKQAAVQGVLAYGLTKGGEKLAATKATKNAVKNSDEVLESSNTKLIEKTSDKVDDVTKVSAAGDTTEGITADVVDDAGNVVGKTKVNVKGADNVDDAMKAAAGDTSEGITAEVVDDAGNVIGETKVNVKGADSVDDAAKAAAGDTSEGMTADILDADGNVVGETNYKFTEGKVKGGDKVKITNAETGKTIGKAKVGTASTEDAIAAAGDTASKGAKGLINKVSNSKVANAVKSAGGKVSNAASKVGSKVANSKVVTAAGKVGSKVANSKVGGAVVTAATSNVGSKVVTIGAGNLVTAGDRNHVVRDPLINTDSSAQFNTATSTNYINDKQPTIETYDVGTTGDGVDPVIDPTGNGDNGNGGTPGYTTGGGGGGYVPPATYAPPATQPAITPTPTPTPTITTPPATTQPVPTPEPTPTTPVATVDPVSTQPIATQPAITITTGGGGETYHTGGGYSYNYDSGIGSSSSPTLGEGSGPTASEMESIIEAGEEAELPDLIDDATTSLDDVVRGSTKYTKIPTSSGPISKQTSSKGGGSAVIPIAAGLSAAAAAGLGAKAYIDRKRNNDNDEDDEFDTEEWSEDDNNIDLSYNDNTEKESYLDDDDDYGYQEMETEKYGARNNEELADMQ